MSAEEFRQEMLRFARPTREFIVTEGADEPLPRSKISGQPWWPEGTPRPKCKYGHLMSFIAQILLSDVPLADMPQNTLLSFHYCDECTRNGRMSFGYFDEENRGYDLTILYNVDKAKADMKGWLAPALIDSYNISFRDMTEVPGSLGDDANIKYENLPIDFPQGKDDFDEDIYAGLKHVHKSKIGGWPTWAQNPEWPLDNGKKYNFLSQFDWWLFDKSPWCTGYAYLFIAEVNKQLKAELVIQTT